MTDRLTANQRAELVQWMRAGARPRLEHKITLPVGYLEFARADDYYRTYWRPNAAAIELAGVYDEGSEWVREND